MKKIKSGNCEFELVDSIPQNGYMIWNIGKNMIEGYLPLCRLSPIQPFEGGRCIETNTLKAIKIDEAQAILSVVGYGNDTVAKMEKYIDKYENSKESTKACLAEKYKVALQIMKNIKGIEHLTD